MGRKAANLTGREFGRLTVIGVAEKIGRNGASLCRCVCGTVKVVMNMSLLNPRQGTKSCGCLARESASRRVKENPPRLKHGMRRTTTYNSWQGMVSRCTNPDDVNFPRYGGRGITVCKRWSDPDMGLINFVEDMGHRPSPAHSIDRIKSGKGYEPGNCRWATRAEQNQNTGLKKSNSTGYKGIAQIKSGLWTAEIRADGQRYYLGTYKTKTGAALAYNLASQELHGIYGQRNPLPPMSKKTVLVVSERVKKYLCKGDIQ